MLVGLLSGLGGLLVVGLVIFVAARRILRQDDETKAWRGLGVWRPVPPDPRSLEWIRRNFSVGIGGVLGLAHGAEVSAVMQGEHRGFRATAFEWTWRELGTRRPRREFRTIISIELPAPRPTLEISREGFGSALRRDLELGWAPFDQTFRVVTGNSVFARDVLTPSTMQWLLADPRSAYFPVRFDGATVSTWDKTRLHVEELGAPVDFLAELLSRVPQHVWH